MQACAGADAAGDSVSIIWKGPLREDDREQQIQVVEGFLSPGRERHRARAARSPSPRASGGGGEARRSPDRDHRLRARVRPDRELRRDRQLQGRRRSPPTASVSCWTARARCSSFGYQEGSASTEEREQGFLEQIAVALSRASRSCRRISTPARRARRRSAHRRICSTASAATCRASSRPTSRRPSACCSRCRTWAKPARSSSSASTRARCSSTPCARISSTASPCRTRCAWATSA